MIDIFFQGLFLYQLLINLTEVVLDAVVEAEEAEVVVAVAVQDATGN